MNNLTGKYIYHYNYYYNDGSADRGVDNRFTITKHQGVLESETEVIIDIHGFSVLQKECDYRLALNSPSIVLDVESKDWGNGVIFDLFSTTELTTSAIKVLILGEIKQKLKFLGVTGLDVINHKVNEVVKWTLMKQVTLLKWI